jgi:hypothetical protein
MASMTVQQFKSTVVVLLLSTIAISCGSNKEVLTSTVPSTTTTVAVESPSTTATSSSTGGPQTPPCGTFEVVTTELIAGQKFLPGQYQINAFGIPCEEVMGDTGLFSQFLQLKDDEDLPEPWRFLEGAVGAPKFVSGPAVGFRVQRISD